MISKPSLLWSISFNNRRVDYLLIALLFIIVNTVLFFRYGLKIVNDTPRYVDYASGLSGGLYVDPFNIWYIGYSGYILLLTKLSGGLAGVVAGQYILSFLAVFALYLSSLLLWEDRVAALFTALLYLLFLDIQTWNSYILTESVYTSCICICLYCYVKIYREGARWGFIILTILISLFTLTIKPTGIALLGALLVVLMYHVLKKIQRKVVVISLVVITFLCFLFLVDYMLENYLIMENYRLGEVIYAVTTVKQYYNIDHLLLEVPSNLYQPPEDYPPLLKIILFVVHHPVYWLNLFLHKIFFLFIHVRPFWSIRHNIYSLIILIPSYICFVRGISDEVRQGLLPSLFAVTYILLHILSIGMTSNDWDGRFLIPVLPVVFLYAGKGLKSTRGFKTG